MRAFRWRTCYNCEEPARACGICWTCIRPLLAAALIARLVTWVLP